MGGQGDDDLLVLVDRGLHVDADLGSALQLLGETAGPRFLEDYPRRNFSAEKRPRVGTAHVLTAPGSEHRLPVYQYCTYDLDLILRSGSRSIDSIWARSARSSSAKEIPNEVAVLTNDEPVAGGVLHLFSHQQTGSKVTRIPCSESNSKACPVIELDGVDACDTPDPIQENPRLSVNTCSFTPLSPRNFTHLMRNFRRTSEFHPEHR